MIEYLYDAVRAVAGQEFKVSARITDSTGAIVSEGCEFIIHGPDKMTRHSGTYYEDVQLWEFTIPAEATEGMKGRYFYCVQRGNENLCFLTPLYLK